MRVDDEQSVRPVLSAALMVARLLVTLLPVTTSSSFPATAAELIFHLKIEHGHVPDSMRLIRVKEGDVVTLRCTTDRAAVLHLHGYDIEKPIAPGAVTELTFRAYATGRFPIYVHAHGGLAQRPAHQEVPLVDVEVYPQ
jgi:hypothetical protein